MRDFKIFTRLLVLVGVLSALLVALGAIGLFGIARSNAAMESMYQNRMQAQRAVADFRYLTTRNRQLVSNALLSPAPEKVAKAIEEAEANIGKSDQAWEALLATAMSPERQKYIQAIGEQRQKIMKEGLAPALAAALNVNPGGLALEDWLAQIHPADRDELRSRLQALQQHGEALTLSVRLRNGDPIVR